MHSILRNYVQLFLGPSMSFMLIIACRRIYILSWWTQSDVTFSFQTYRSIFHATSCSGKNLKETDIEKLKLTLTWTLQVLNLHCLRKSPTCNYSSHINLLNYRCKMPYAISILVLYVFFFLMFVYAYRNRYKGYCTFWWSMIPYKLQNNVNTLK